MTARTIASRTKTLAELQAILSDQIDRIANDETTPAKVNAVVNATATILRTVKLQMDYYRQIGKTPSIPLLLTAETSDA
jgi:hypothetical protein